MTIFRCCIFIWFCLFMIWNIKESLLWNRNESLKFWIIPFFKFAFIFITGTALIFGI